MNQIRAFTKRSNTHIHIFIYYVCQPTHLQTPNIPTLIRQELVTTCFGSTISTSGSIIAMLRMQVMSKPYTFSHPRSQLERHVITIQRIKHLFIYREKSFPIIPHPKMFYSSHTTAICNPFKCVN